MDWLASWIWNPVLSFVYIEIGLLFLYLTKGVAWRKPFRFINTIVAKPTCVTTSNFIPHSHAFLTALAASVGVGNVAGVGTALHLGGPGALFWIWMSAIVGNSFRMCATYMAIKHGPTDPNSPSFATPMAYLDKFLPAPWRWISATLAGLILIKGLVTANLIQANSVAHALTNEFGTSNLVVAVMLMVAVAIVIIGGLKSIVKYCIIVAPWMLIAYIGCGMTILILNPLQTIDAILLVFQHAFQPFAIAGGVIGYGTMQAMQFGISRGVFSHNSGMGIAPFLHGANRDNPIIGAKLAALVPLVDTLIICSITGLVILSLGQWQELTGAFLTASTFESALGYTGKIVVIACLIIFAFTTMINWAHFSERCFQYLGGKNVIAFRWFFTLVTFLGPFFPVALIWSTGDVLIGLIIILHLLSLTYILLKNLPVFIKDFKGQ